MVKNIEDLASEYLSDDPRKLGKLSSEINYRRLELLLLREILLELKKLNNANLPAS